VIASVETTNVRGHDRKVVLGAKTLIVGPNGSGKSTVSVGAHWTLLGYVPGLAKTGAALMANARADYMDGTVDVDGVVIKRLLLTKDGKTSERVKVGAVEVKGNAADGVVEMALKRRPDTVLFDSSAFWSLSDAQRIQVILTRLGGPGAEKLIAGEKEAKEKLNDARTARRGALAAVESISGRLSAMPAARPQNVVTKDLEQARATLSELDADLAKGKENDRRRTELRAQVAGLPALRAEAESVQAEVVTGRRQRETAVRDVEAARRAVEAVPPSHPGRSPWMSTEVVTLLQSLRGLAVKAPARADIVSAIDGAMVVGDPVDNSVALREARAVLESAELAVKALERAIEANVRRAGTLQERVRLWAKAEAELDRVGPGVTPEATSARVGAAKLVEDLTAELSACGRRAGIDGELEAARIAADKAELDEQAAKTALEVASGKIRGLLASMAADAEKVASALLPHGKLVFDTEGLSDGKLVLAWAIDGEHPVDRRALSGGEGVLFDAAICRLLGGVGATLFVEAGECDDSTLAKSLSAIAKNDPGQVVIMRWVNAGQPAPVVDGWEVVAL